MDTVYLIDDLAQGLKYLSDPIANAGYRPVWCSSLAEFARQFDKDRARTVFIDLQVGTHDAIDVLDVVRESGSRAAIYLVGGDAHRINCSRRYAEEVGLVIRDCLQKPMADSQILDCLKDKDDALRAVFDQVDVIEAIRKNWIYPVLQPKLDLASGKILSAELLCRMAHPTFGIVAPQTFIGQMSVEQNQELLLHHLSFFGEHFLYDPRRGNEFRININTDVQTLFNAQNVINSLIGKSPHFLRNLIFELTEENLTALDNDHLKMLYKLRMAGANFSIDDFGVGVSNFDRVSHLPVQEIKIDKSIAQGSATVKVRGIVFRSIVNLARAIGVRVVAEGVETVDDFNFVEASGCDELQGYFVARPMKLPKLAKFIKDFNNPARVTTERAVH
jgi:EAL domain-containing protein (putative c-di-GMP-specific phosphodiesterase class I)